MNKLPFVLVALLIIAIAFAYHPAQKAPQVQAQPQPKKLPAAFLVPQYDPNPHTQKLIADYDEFISNAIKNGSTPGAAVAIIRDTSIIYLKGHGVKAGNTHDSVDVNTVFRIGSVSKSLTAILVGRLVEDHKLNWDDPVIRYVPTFKLKDPEVTNTLTIRHVLSHTTGLPYHAFTNMVEEGLPLDTLINSLKTLDLTGAPGKMYSYQNVGFSIIEKVIVSATGKTFEEAIAEYLFKPLHMSHASASYEAIMSNHNAARPNFRTLKGWATKSISKTYYNVAPAGGINASISDMGLWLKAIAGNHPYLLSDETRQEIFKPVVRAISKNRSFGLWKWPRASYYGLGWRIITFKADTLYYHGGYVNGFRSEVAFNPKSRMAVCVLTNSPGNIASQAVPQFFAIYQAHRDSIMAWEDRHRKSFALK